MSKQKCSCCSGVHEHDHAAALNVIELSGNTARQDNLQVTRFNIAGMDCPDCAKKLLSQSLMGWSTPPSTSRLDSW